MDPQNPSNQSSAPSETDLVQPKEVIITPTVHPSGGGAMLPTSQGPGEPSQPNTAINQFNSTTPSVEQVIPDSNAAAPEAPQAAWTHPDHADTPSDPSPDVPPAVPQPVTDPIQPVSMAPQASEASPFVHPIYGGTESTTPVVSKEVADPTMPASPPKKRFLLPKAVLLAFIAFLFLGGSTAAAYYGVVIPNKPDNVLKAAIANSLQEQQVSFNGTIEGGPAKGSGTAYKATVTGSSDAAAKSGDVMLNVTVSGATFSIEARLVNQNLYVKLGDLTTITGLIGSYSPDLAKTATSVNSTLSNQWVEFDSTLLKQAGGSCVLDTSWSLTKADLQLLQNQYLKHQFVTIKSSTTDTVNGKKVDKMVLSINDDTASAFSKELDSLSIIKALNSCAKSTKPSGSIVTADHDTTPITVWVDKGTKHIVQIASQSTAKDAASGNIKASGVLALQYGKVSITAPTNVKPALQVLTKLEGAVGATGLDLTSLFSGSSAASSLAGSSSLDSGANDSVRKTDIAYLQTNLEAYFAEHGNYPSFAQMNSSSWRQANLSGYDQSGFQDPEASSPTLTQTPAAKAYAYQPTNSSKGSCEKDATTCANYTLTATLSTGTTYVKVNLD